LLSLVSLKLSLVAEIKRKEEENSNKLSLRSSLYISRPLQQVFKQNYFLSLSDSFSPYVSMFRLYKKKRSRKVSYLSQSVVQKEEKIKKETNKKQKKQKLDVN
jgi:hypothetical protein